MIVSVRRHQGTQQTTLSSVYDAVKTTVRQSYDFNHQIYDEKSQQGCPGARIGGKCRFVHMKKE